MGQRQPVETINAKATQTRHDDLASCLRVRPGIDQQRMFAKPQQDGVPLAHVKYANFQFTRRKREGRRSAGRSAHRLTQHDERNEDQKPNDRQRTHRRTRPRQRQR